MILRKPVYTTVAFLEYCFGIPSRCLLGNTAAIHILIKTAFMKLPLTHQTFPNFRLLCTYIMETEKLPRSDPVQQLPKMKKLYPDIQCTQQLYAIVCDRWSKRRHLAVWRFLFYVRPITAETERSVVCPTLHNQLRDSYGDKQSIWYITLGTQLWELLSK